MIKVKQLEHSGQRYLLYYPLNYEEGKKYPVMFHLHGAGGRGRDYAEFKDSCIIALLNKGDSPLANGFTVIPQCEDDTWFVNLSRLMEFVHYIYNRSFVDKTRFNASGISMGGYAIYQVMMNAPELFNKAIVCCGGGMYWNAFKMNNIKFRIFHGEQDTAVFPEESRRMYNRLKEANADVTLTIYPECDHNCWEKTYLNYDNLKWLFE